MEIINFHCESLKEAQSIGHRSNKLNDEMEITLDYCFLFKSIKIDGNSAVYYYYQMVVKITLKHTQPQ